MEKSEIRYEERKNRKWETPQGMGGGDGTDLGYFQRLDVSAKQSNTTNFPPLDFNQERSL